MNKGGEATAITKKEMGEDEKKRMKVTNGDRDDKNKAKR